MASFKSTNKIKVYEISGSDKECGVGGPEVKVVSHWSNRRLVLLKYGDVDITVEATALKAAIDNCVNAHS